MGQETELKVFVNGKIVPESQAMISALDRGFRWGDSVYDQERTFGGKIFKLQSHMKRLYRSLHYTRIDPRMTIEEMSEATEGVIEANRHMLGPNDDFTVTQIVSRGLMNRPQHGSNVVIYSTPIAFANFARQYVEGVRVVNPATRRNPPQSLSPKAKIGNKMNHLIADFEAKDRDPEAVSLMLDLNGNIAECTGANFAFVVDGRLKVPNRRHVLPGIGMETVLEVAENQGIPIDEDDYTPFDVYQADEAFVMGSSTSLLPARSLNGWQVGDELPGPITRALTAAYGDLAGVNIVDQALSHLTPEERASLSN
jgi:branched-chain amino acid aminotransferase